MQNQSSDQQSLIKSNLICMLSMMFFSSGFVAVEYLLNAGWHPVYLNFLSHIQQLL